MHSTGSSKLREIRHHLPTDENTHRHNQRTEPDPGPQHGENRGSPTLRKDVGLVKINYINDRHPESFAELDGFLASPCHHSSNHCQNLHPEKTNHPSAQSITIEFDKHHFVPPCFFETKKHFVCGGDVERIKSTKLT